VTNLFRGSYTVRAIATDNAGLNTYAYSDFNVVGPIQSLINAAAPGSTEDHSPFCSSAVSPLIFASSC